MSRIRAFEVNEFNARERLEEQRRKTLQWHTWRRAVAVAALAREPTLGRHSPRLCTHVVCPALTTNTSNNAFRTSNNLREVARWNVLCVLPYANILVPLRGLRSQYGFVTRGRKFVNHRWQHSGRFLIIV